MSKITFRADDDLVARLEDLDASKSEVMREALREYLDRNAAADPTPSGDATPADDGSATLDDVLATRIDELLSERLDARLDRLLDQRLPAASRPASQPQDINLSINLDGARVGDASADARSSPTQEPASSTSDAQRETAESPEPSRGQPREAERAETAETGCNQCGENLSDDHVFCPNCGEKRSHRVFCDCGDEVRSDWAFCPGCGRRTPAADVLERS